MNKKAKPWFSVFVHVEGVPWSQSVWDSRGQRKPLRPLAEEEVGECRVLLESRGGGGGSWRRESSLRKEQGRKRLGKCTAGADAEERAGKGACPCRQLRAVWEKELRFQDGGTGRSRKTQLGEVENCFQVENSPGNGGWNWRVKPKHTKRYGKCH